MNLRITFLSATSAIFCTIAANAAHISSYSNNITADNIAVMQHFVINNAIQNFSGAEFAHHNIQLTDTNTPETNSNLYGSMLYYGEYGDDYGTTSTRGRNGGDNLQISNVSHVWANWQHYNDDVKLTKNVKMDTAYNIGMAGINGGATQFASGVIDFGFYTGYIGGTQDNRQLDIDEHGGFLGLYTNYSHGAFNLYASINSGLLYNHAKNIYGTDEFSNIWMGSALHATYNLYINNTFIIQPNVYFGYTWIKSPDYVAHSGEHLYNKNFNMYDITPGIKLIKDLTYNWNLSIDGKYIINHLGNNGHFYSDTTAIKQLKNKNFFEYGINIEKQIKELNFSANIKRHDGGYTGWNFGLGIKYLF